MRPKVYDLACQLYDACKLLYKLSASDMRVDQRPLTIPDSRAAPVWRSDQEFPTFTRAFRFAHRSSQITLIPTITVHLILRSGSASKLLRILLLMGGTVGRSNAKIYRTTRSYMGKQRRT
jgi:hypothetical protein